MRYIRTAIFLVVIGLGWKYPILAYCMFLDILLGMYGALKNGGRFGCGNYCPRGAFYTFMPDTGRKIPPALLKKSLSLVLLPMLLTGLIVWQRPGSITEFGRVLYWLIAITTAFGIIGSFVFNRGFWCAVCPMGKLLRLIRPGKSAVFVESNCVHCGLCSKACPLSLNPAGQAKDGVFTDRNCLLCGKCAKACRKGALSLRMVQAKDQEP